MVDDLDLVTWANRASAASSRWSPRPHHGQMMSDQTSIFIESSTRQGRKLSVQRYRSNAETTTRFGIHRSRRRVGADAATGRSLAHKRRLRRTSMIEPGRLRTASRGEFRRRSTERVPPSIPVKSLGLLREVDEFAITSRPLQRLSAGVERPHGFFSSASSPIVFATSGLDFVAWVYRDPRRRGELPCSVRRLRPRRRSLAFSSGISTLDFRIPCSYVHRPHPRRRGHSKPCSGTRYAGNTSLEQMLRLADQDHRRRRLDPAHSTFHLHYQRSATFLAARLSVFRQSVRTFGTSCWFIVLCHRRICFTEHIPWTRLLPDVYSSSSPTQQPSRFSSLRRLNFTHHRATPNLDELLQERPSWDSRRASPSRSRRQRSIKFSCFADNRPVEHRNRRNSTSSRLRHRRRYP